MILLIFIINVLGVDVLGEGGSLDNRYQVSTTMENYNDLGQVLRVSKETTSPSTFAISDNVT